MLAVTFYDVVKWVHIMAVVVAFGGAFTYPVWFGFVRRAAPGERVFFHRAQAFIGQWVITPGLVVIILAGAYMATENDLWGEPWVIVALAIIAIIGGLGGAVVVPSSERMSQLRPESAEYAAVYSRYMRAEVTLGVLVLVAIFFMAAKPF